MGKDYWQLISQRAYPRESHKYPTLVSYFLGKEQKRHFSYCAENCRRNVKTFATLWLGRFQYWIERLNLSNISHETNVLDNFLPSYLEDITKCNENRRTYLSESFHSLVTHYCPKSVPYRFETYKVRKYLVVLH